MATAIGLFVLRAHQSRRVEPVVSGLLEAPELRLGSRVGGRVKRVLVREAETVKAEQPLIELEAPDLTARLEEARAQVAVLRAAESRVRAGFRREEIAAARAARDAARAALAEAENGPRAQELEQGRQAVALARAELEMARLSHGRSRSLVGKGAVPVDTADRSRTTLAVAEATVRAREAELKLLQEGTRRERVESAKARLAEAEAQLTLRERGSRAEDKAEAEARVAAALRTVAAQEELVRELTIRAPVAGRVEALDLEPGDLVGAGAPALTVLATDRLWVRAYAPQRFLSVVKPGAELEVTFDALPGKRFRAKVGFVASQAEFTPSNVQTPEERGRQVYRFKLDVPASPDLHPGMTGDVHLGP